MSEVIHEGPNVSVNRFFGGTRGIRHQITILRDDAGGYAYTTLSPDELEALRKSLNRYSRKRPSRRGAA